MQLDDMEKNAIVTVRLPAVLKQQLEEQARRERRSLSSQIALNLERSVAREPRTGSRGRLLGRFAGRRVPTEEEFAEARRMLWSSLGERKARDGA
jgi:predicted transcriptional regulator